jgi:sarcosine oxidase subunit alpha
MSAAGPRRLPTGGRIQRAQRADFDYNGRRIEAFEGDTIASALLASGHRVVARSFKYHRPRGILGAGVDECNALMGIGVGDQHEPNLPATLVQAHAGLQVFTQNAWPSVLWDWRAINGLFSPMFSAGFYYKTFMGPFKGTRAWMFFEEHIRRAAGMGKANEQADRQRYDAQHDFVDLLVVGSGPAGLSAALAAADSGLDVMLVEQDFELGGSLLQHSGQSAWGQWLSAGLARLRAAPRVRLLTRSTAFGLYDGNTMGVVEQAAPGRHDPALGEPRQRLRTVRFGAVVMACGAIERPLVFAGNDRPGVMLAGAVGHYLERQAVQCGQSALFAVNNDAAYASAMALARSGARVTLADSRLEVNAALLQEAGGAGVTVQLGCTVVQAQGAKGVHRATLAAYDPQQQRVGALRETLAVDLVAMSGGYTPTVHLSSHLGSKPVYSAAVHGFLPGALPPGHFCAGAMTGSQDGASAVLSGAQMAQQALAHLGASASSPGASTAPAEAVSTSMAFLPLPVLRHANASGKAFIDFQLDVHAGDVALAHREGYVSVEHLKRYTTLGMGSDQGKTSNMGALSAMAATRQLPIEQVGTTTFRPPFTPVTVGALAGRGVGRHYRAVRRTAIEPWHRAQQAVWTEAGLWRRALWYKTNGASIGTAYRAEMALVRQGTGMADVSTLGKIDVQGPDAAEFLNRVYTNGFAKLPVGKARYGLMLREDGMVLDDGTTSRLSEHHFFMTTTTGQAARVMMHLEFLLQVVWPDLRVTVASSSDQWAAMSIAGRDSRRVLEAAFPAVDVGPQALPHMGLIEARVNGVPLRIIRLSFSGELAFEVYTPTHHGLPVWAHLMAAGRPWNLQAYGLEALASLRIEKGHVTGSELDGRTTLNDVGMGKMASKLKPYWGQALSQSPNLIRENRPTLVGLEAIDAGQPPTNGSILFFEDDAIRGVGRGHITSTCFSADLGKPIGLGLLQEGAARIGSTVIAAAPVLGRQYKLRVVSPHFLDPHGSRYLDPAPPAPAQANNTGAAA